MRQSGAAGSRRDGRFRTTVSTNLNDLAAKAINLLLKRIDEDGTDFKPEKLTADFRLVQRESTGR